MSEEPITQEQIDDLLAKLRATEGLADNQRELLEAMIKMVTEVDEVTVRTNRPVLSESPGDISFTPGVAQLVLSYASDESDSEGPATKQSQVVNYITR